MPRREDRTCRHRNTGLVPLNGRSAGGCWFSDEERPAAEAEITSQDDGDGRKGRGKNIDSSTVAESGELFCLAWWRAVRSRRESGGNLLSACTLTRNRATGG